MSGTSQEMAIQWETGRLGVEVEPDRGIQLQVETPDGTVRVVGTGFVVDRSSLGTTVEVRHGRVEVRCLRGERATLGAGEAHTCLPATAEGALLRVLALEPLGVSEAFLAEIDAALSLDGAALAGPSCSRIVHRRW